MDKTSLRAEFDRNGFVIVRQLLQAYEFTDLSQQLDRYIREIVPTLDDSHAFYEDKSRPETLKQMQHMGRDPYFRDYVQHPQWIELARTLAGEEVIPMEPEWFNKPAGANQITPPHQDNFYFCLDPPN